MYIKLNDGTFYNVEGVREDKVRNSDNSSFWLLRFVIIDAVSSNDIDSIFTSDNTSKLLIGAEDSDTIIQLTGYSELQSASISINNLNIKCIVQLKKIVMTETEAAE